MNVVNFEIVRIYAGWFDVKFISENKEIEISASDVWGNDSPMHYLRLILGILNNRVKDGYVVFDEEPGTYIVCLETTETVKLSILYSDFDDDEWTKIGLHGELSRQEIEKIIPNTEELFVVKDFSIQAFAKTILRGFEEWSLDLKKSEYEENWMEYPQKEVEELNNIIYNWEDLVL